MRDAKAQGNQGNLVMDPATGKIYNLVLRPPPQELLDGGTLVQRSDDTKEALVTRLRRNVKTRPLSLKLIAKCESSFLDGSGRVASGVLRRLLHPVAVTMIR